MIVFEALGILAVLTSGAWLVTWAITGRPSPGYDSDPDERMLREYTRLTVAAAEASRKGHEGEALVYGEAARKLLETVGNLEREETMRVRTVITVAAVAVLAVGCGSDGGPNPDAEASIRSCIARRGTPQYTVDKYGDVIHFLGCVEVKP